MAVTTDAVALQALYSRLGVVVGSAVAKQVSDALNLSNTDVAALQQRMATIESILDADPNTPEFDAAQNIITQITNLTNRLNNAENPAVAGSLANQIASLTTQLTALSGVVDAIKSSVGLNADGTITLPEASADATGEYAYLYNDDGTPATNLLEAVKLFAKKAGSTLQGVLSSISDLQSRMGAAEAAITTLNGNVTTLQGDMAQVQSDVATLDAAFSDADALVAAFCQGVNSGLSGATDLSCTIASGSGSSGSGL